MSTDPRTALMRAATEYGAAMNVASDRGKVVAAKRAAVNREAARLLVAQLEDVNARAEAEMLRTGVLEGAHGRAVAAVLAEWRQRETA